MCTYRLISFLLFMVEQTTATLPEAWLISFEFAHIVLFFMAVAYTAQCVHATLLVLKSKGSWEEMGALRPKQLKKQISELAIFFQCIPTFFRRWRVPEVVAVFLLRTLFVSKHKLPKDFEVRCHCGRIVALKLRNSSQSTCIEH
jgi:hypothetical protein